MGKRTKSPTLHAWLLVQLRGLDSTTLHYLAVRETMASVHRPVHSKITLTYSPGKLTAFHPVNGFQGANKHQSCCFLGFAQVFSVYVKKNCQNFTVNYAIMCVGTSTSTYAQLSPLYLLSILYVTHVMNFPRPSTAFPYCKRRKAAQGLGTKISGQV